MNLVIQKIKDKQYVSFKESFWDPQKKRYSSRTVKNFGRLDILEKDNPNVLEELKAQAAKAKALAQEKKELILKQRVNELSNEKNHPAMQTIFRFAWVQLFTDKSGIN